ncbi:hypothetical protein B2D45_03730 [Lactobacillus hilgardii]
MASVVKNYTVSKYGKIWTLNLRHSKWSDGSAVTVKNFVYLWQRTVNLKTADQYSYILVNIKNATRLKFDKMASSRLDVKADANYKLVITLEKTTKCFDRYRLKGLLPLMCQLITDRIMWMRPMKVESNLALAKKYWAKVLRQIGRKQVTLLVNNESAMMNRKRIAFFPKLSEQY